MDKLRVVLAGCGAVSRAWVDALKARDDTEIVGFVDLVREAAEKRAAELDRPGAAVGTNLKAMLRKTRPDVVCDCTVPAAHLPTALAALKAGCHVFGEKPLADTMAHARRIVRAAQAAGKVHAVMQNRRYIPAMRALRAFLDSGAIGPVTTVYCDFFLAPRFGGFRDRMEHVLLLDMAVHTFDQARFLTRRDPLTALAHEWNPPGSWYDHDASAAALFEMTGGVVFGYRGSWCAQGMSTSWEASWRIIGQKGSVLWDGADTFRAEVAEEADGSVRTRPAEVPLDPNTPAVKFHAGCIDEMIESVKAGRTPQTVCTDNIKSLAMVHAAIESARKGRRVALIANSEQ